MTDLLDIDVAIDVLTAAIQHARKEAPMPNQRRRFAVFYLEVEYLEAVRRREYRRASAIGILNRRIRSAALLTSLLDTLVSWREKQRSAEGTPAGNTGVTVPRVCKVYPRG